MTQQYDYLENVKNDVIDFIKDNAININEIDREELNDQLWVEDSVTGNGSGSYTFNANKAKEYVDDNKDLIREAIDEGFMDRQKTAEWWLDDCYESIDVSLRCYVLSQAIDDAIEELED